MFRMVPLEVRKVLEDDQVRSLGEEMFNAGAMRKISKT